MQQTTVVPFEFDRSDGSIREIVRWASLAAATSAIVYGVSRRTVPGIWMAIAASPFAYRSWVGAWPFSNDDDDTRTALARGRGIHVRESIRLEMPVAQVYRFWRQFQNLPRFMTYLERVTEFGDRGSHWVAKGPAGTTVEWDAEIINEVENKVIGWRSLPGSDVATAGSVTFTPLRGGRTTELSVNLQYQPPAGRTGALLAAIFGREPSQTIREDLRRVKQLLEAGEISTGELKAAPESDVSSPRER
jgi:uncharacterized membrane protein